MEKETEYRYDQAPPEYAILGNNSNTYFPVVNEGGKPTENFTREYIADFTNKFPEQSSNMNLLVGTIEAILGNSIENIRNILQKISKNAQIIGKIREKIFSMAPFKIKGVENLPEESKKIILDDMEHTMAEQADGYIEGIIKNTFKQQIHTLSLKEEVKNCQNSAKLLRMVLDSDFDPRIRYEARRKLTLMYYFAKLKMIRTQEHYDEKVDHKEGLEWLMDIIDRQISPIQHGEVGKSEPWVIDSIHDPKNNMIAIPNLTTIKPKEEAEDFNKINGKRTEIAMRKSKFKNNKQEIIWFHINSRSKKHTLEKAMRNGEEIGTKYTDKDDRSGKRIMVRNEEEWEILYENLKKAINTEVKKEIAQISKQCNVDTKIYDNCIIETRKKGSIGGGEIKSTSKASAGFKGLKVDITIKRPDENGETKTHTFEIQAFLPHNFVDYFNELGHTWAEYNVNRFFYPIMVIKDKKEIEYCSMAELLFPKEIYKGIDYESLRKESIKSTIASIWPDLNKEIEIEPLRKAPKPGKPSKKDPEKKGGGTSEYRKKHANNKSDSKRKNRT